MKTLGTIIALVVMALLVAPAFGGDDAVPQRTLYEEAIDKEIAQSRQMASLLSSRSTNLRKKGHREASMAMFLETHRERLVDDMIALNIEPKTYQVERFLDDRFNSICYATWAVK